MKTRLLILTGIGMIVFAGLIQMSYAEEIFMFLEKDIRKIYYTGENLNSAFFDHDSASIIFELGENATLDLKIPQVYKIGGDLFVLINGEEVDENATTDDCFYYASFESKTPERLEVIFAHWAEAPERTDNCEIFVVSPLKQFKLGVPNNSIKCKDGLNLLIKISDGSPACVSIETKAALIHRSWANGEKSVAGKILEELRKGPQGITEEQSDYVKKIILLDPQVRELISGREYDFHCCAYVSDNNHYPYHHTLSITININNSSDQIVVGFDLDEVKISSVSEGLQRGSGGVVPFKPEHGPERITPP
jgi:hypothetical protein